MITDATFTDSNHRVVCPVSMENANLLSNFALHYTTQKQIERFGMCWKCRKRMKETGKAILAGKVETPAAIEKHHTLTAEDHTGFTDGEITQTVDFDFDEIDQRNGWHEAGEIFHNASEQARHEAGEVLREVFQFCFGTHRKKLGASGLKTAAMRFAVVVSGLRPDILNDATHGELARHLSRTKASASKASCEFEDRHGIQFARSRKPDARAAMRAARLAQGGVCRHKPKDTADGRGQAEEGGTATPAAVKGYHDPMQSRLVSGPLHKSVRNGF